MLTIENGTAEETDELEEHVLLLGGEFVPASVLSAAFDFRGVKTLPHIGLEPVGGSDEAAGTSALLGGLLPELPCWHLLGCGRLGLFHLSVGVPVGVDVLDQTVVESAVLVASVTLEKEF